MLICIKLWDFIFLWFSPLQEKSLRESTVLPDTLRSAKPVLFSVSGISDLKDTAGNCTMVAPLKWDLQAHLLKHQNSMLSAIKCFLLFLLLSCSLYSLFLTPHCALRAVTDT